MIPVHNHSQYSALDGYSKVEEIAARIEQLGLPGAFLTDHGTVAGLFHFAKEMEKRDLFYGFGMEAYQARTERSRHEAADGHKFKKGEDSFHLILLAKDEEGYRNLLRLADESHRTGFYYDPRVDWGLLERYREGVIATTACMGSLVNESVMEGNLDPLNAFIDIFGFDDFYIELHTYTTPRQEELNKQLVEIATKRGLPLLYANDAHYARPEMYEIHEALLCAQYHTKFDEPKTRKDGVSNYPADANRYHPPCLYIMSEEDVRAALHYLPDSAVDEAIRNSDELMKRCSVKLTRPGTFLPTYNVPKPEYSDAADMLEALVVDGLREKYEGALTPDVVERAMTEFQAIIDAGLQDYFLIQWDTVRWALDHGIMVGPGRGSVGGSMLAHALDITNIDPIKYGLQFERFWNPGRSDGLPDIDVDYERARIDEVRQYVLQKYGDSRVLRIGNHVYLRAKAAIGKAAMVIDNVPPYKEINTIKAIIDTTTDAGQQPAWPEMWELLGEWAAKEGKPHPLDEYVEKWPDLFDLAEALEGRISTYSVHASAIVISSIDLHDQLPARMASDDEKQKVLVTQAEMKQVEKSGFPKFDFLGLRNLDTLMLTALLSGEFGEDSRETRKEIVLHYRHGVTYDHLADSYWEQIDNKHTLGLFQIEEAGPARRIGKDIRPRSVEDLAAIVALNRPGPLRSKDESGRNMVERFVARRGGDEETVYPHEILDEILAPTYGDFLYQEQVIAYFRALGYDLSDADHIRKILGKKLVKEMQAELPRYMGLAEKFMPRAVAESIWALIEDFSKYSFNKAHAVGYGLILAWTMYAKRKWPVEFILASIITNPKRVPDYVREAKRLGVKVLPPDVTTSETTISRVGDAILYGLLDIKGIGRGAANWIVKHRPFERPEDVIALIRENKSCACNLGAFKILMDAGAFDAYDYRLSECAKCEGTGRYSTLVPKKSGDGEKRARVACDHCDQLGFSEVGLPDREQRMKKEDAYLGIRLTDVNEKLIEEYREYVATLDSYASVDKEEEGSVRVPGVVVGYTLLHTGPHTREPGREMAKIVIEWDGEQLECIAMPNQWDSFKSYGRSDRFFGEFHLVRSNRLPQLQKALRLS